MNALTACQEQQYIFHRKVRLSRHHDAHDDLILIPLSWILCQVMFYPSDSIYIVSDRNRFFSQLTQVVWAACVQQKAMSTKIHKMCIIYIDIPEVYVCVWCLPAESLCEALIIRPSHNKSADERFWLIYNGCYFQPLIYLLLYVCLSDDVCYIYAWKSDRYLISFVGVGAALVDQREINYLMELSET
jgi:hypothetical protein